MRLIKNNGIIAIGVVVCLLLAMFPAVPGSAVAENGLVAQYKFDGDFKDASGNGNDGTAEGSVSLADDSVVGKCAMFSGGLIRVKAVPALNLGNQFTISVWIKVDPAMAVPKNLSGTIIKKYDDRELYYTYHLFTKGVFGTKAFMGTNKSPSVNIQEPAFANLGLDKGWSQLVFAGSGDTLTLYHNGAAIATQKLAGGDAIKDSNGDVIIGGGVDSNKSDFTLKGRMADFRVYNYGLSPQEVKTLYQNGAVMKPKTQAVKPAAVKPIIKPTAKGVISVLINNQPLKLDIAPQVRNGRTLVPLRAIFEGLGATVQWNAADKSITATKGSQTLSLVLGKATATNNGQQVTLEVPPMIIGGRTMVPLRFVSENMGAQVKWEGNIRQVSIVSSVESVENGQAENSENSNVSIEIASPAGYSPKVFTKGWVFSAKCVINPGTDKAQDVSNQIQWSGSGTFEPKVGHLTHPTFKSAGDNYITATYMADGKTYEKTVKVKAVLPDNYAHVGTKGFCGAVAFGCPICPHVVIGPVLTGSPDVTIGGLPAARQGDTGEQSASCGSNTFVISGGDPEVLINGRPAARLGDQTTHSGAYPGRLVP
ncbi:MAG: stalk domain-containing protein [Ignavibacteriales bacterium]